MILLRSLAFNLVMFCAGVVLSLYGQALVVVAPARVIGAGALWARITLRALRRICGVEIVVTGRAYLPTTGPALIAAQHQSAFDTLIWMELLQHPAYVLKQELLSLPLLGGLLVPAGFIAVDRAGGAAALRRMVLDCRAAIAAGKQIVIFPEGTRVPPGSRGVLHPGVVALAHALDLPVVPAATNSGFFWGRKAFLKFPGRLWVKIHPPLPAGMRRLEILSRLETCFYDGAVDNTVDDGEAGL